MAEGEGRGGGLVDDPLDGEAGELARFPHRVALVVVVVGRHGDHRPVHRLVEGLGGELTDLAQDESRDLLQGEVPAREANGGEAPHPLHDLVVKPVPAGLHGGRGEGATHEPLGAVDGVAGIHHHLRLGRLPHQEAPLGVVGHHRRQGPVSLARGEDLHPPVLDHGRAGVGGAEVDPDDLGPGGPASARPRRGGGRGGRSVRRGGQGRARGRRRQGFPGEILHVEVERLDGLLLGAGWLIGAPGLAAARRDEVHEGPALPGQLEELHPHPRGALRLPGGRRRRGPAHHAPAPDDRLAVVEADRELHHRPGRLGVPRADEDAPQGHVEGVPLHERIHRAKGQADAKLGGRSRIAAALVGHGRFDSIPPRPARQHAAPRRRRFARESARGVRQEGVPLRRRTHLGALLAPALR